MTTRRSLPLFLLEEQLPDYLLVPLLLPTPDSTPTHHNAKHQTTKPPSRTPTHYKVSVSNEDFAKEQVEKKQTRRKRRGDKKLPRGAERVVTLRYYTCSNIRGISVRRDLVGQGS
jgi:hypothetical protein